ncbi:MAG: ABC transporter substrate-binding protein [Planctomycetes bacterium]|nr:ABC transporter substrate-binding protein [Planctomycetota bacterium]
MRRDREPQCCGRRTGTRSPIGDTLARVALVATLSLTGASGPAQDRNGKTPQPPKRIGVFFWHDSPNDEAALVGIRAAFAEIGRKDDIRVARAGENEAAGARILAGFQRDGVDLVFAMGTQAAVLASKHVKRTPVVFTAVTNPIDAGLIRSWDGSGSNLAGNSNWIAPDTILQVFRMTVPGIGRLGMIRTPDCIVSASELRALRAHSSGGTTPIEIVEAPVTRAEQLAAAVDRLAAQRVDAIWIPIDPLVYRNTSRLLDAARGRGIPLVSSSLRGTRTGATAGVVVDYVLLGKLAAAIALQILEHGRDPGSLPIGRMHSYRVTVNLEAARQCSYEVPYSLLLLADILLEKIDSVDPPSPRGK